MRSDAAPAINLGMAPTWTAAHVFTTGTTMTSLVMAGTLTGVTSLTMSGALTRGYFTHYDWRHYDGINNASQNDGGVDQRSGSSSRNLVECSGSR